MSLVNKMLRDLDARHVGDDERAALPAAVTPLAAHREPPSLRPWLLAGGVVAAVAAATTFWILQRPFDEALEAAPAPPVAAGPKAPAAAEAAPAAGPTPQATPGGDPAPADGGTAGGLRLSDALASPPQRSVPAKSPAAATPVAVPPGAAPPTTVAPPVRAVAETPAAAATKPPTVSPSGEVRIEKQLRQPTAAEKAEADYRRGVAAARQGDHEAAAAAWRAALDAQPEHAAARQSLSALLIESRRLDEAEDLLRRGSEIGSVRLASVMAWARLKVERNQATAALDVLQRHAAAGERSAEFQGFMAALLNRAGRAAEAAEHYQAATKLAPTEGRWWAGLGIALDASGKSAEAHEAYLRARALPGLPPDLAQHVEQRLR